jgi:hypothetical protein
LGTTRAVAPGDPHGDLVAASNEEVAVLHEEHFGELFWSGPFDGG